MFAIFSKKLRLGLHVGIRINYRSMKLNSSVQNLIRTLCSVPLLSALNMYSAMYVY